MRGTVEPIGGLDAFVLDPEGEMLSGESDALDIIGETYGTEVALIVIPLTRLAPDMLDLRNGRLGAVVQKFTNYQLRAAFVGDLSVATAGSNALRDFVIEANRGGRLLFAPDINALKEMITS